MGRREKNNPSCMMRKGKANSAQRHKKIDSEHMLMTCKKSDPPKNFKVSTSSFHKSQHTQTRVGERANDRIEWRTSIKLTCTFFCQGASSLKMTKLFEARHNSKTQTTTQPPHTHAHTRTRCPM